MPGPPKKPTNLKIVHGTAEKRDLNPAEPKPEIKLPTPPAFLDQAAKREWKRIGASLLKLGLVSDIDVAAFAAYCQAYSRYQKAEKALKDQGYLTMTPNGMEIQSPWVGIANKSLELMHKFLTEFGMTPASRTRISVKTGDKDGDKFGEFLQKGKKKA